jgi:transposase
VRLLKKKLFGSSSEKQPMSYIPFQDDVPLFNEIELVAQTMPPEEPPLSAITEETRISSPPKKPGRQPLPANLPRIIVEHDLLEQDKHCERGHELECIGTQISEELEYTPPRLQVIEHRCKKFICATCAKEKIENSAIAVMSKTARKPAQLLEKSIASPSLLAAIAVAKFNDHLPLYRQQAIFQRSDIRLSRQTMSEWMARCGEAVVPLINLLQDTILDYDVAFADETTVQVLNEPGRRAQAKSYMWCFIGGPPDERAIIYQYHPTRAGNIVDAFFADYKGGLHCDGYGGYNNLLSSSRIVGLNCLAHVRRKFIEALPGGEEKGVSGTVVKQIRVLYRIEQKLKEQNADADTIKRVRQEEAKPRLEELKAYLDDRAKVVPPASAVGKAIQYTLKRWCYLITYLEDGRYKIDNNRAERAIKPFVCGRKNWLFSNSVSGANASARLFSLIETAKANGLNPFTYLTYIFKELPNCKVLADYEALLPWNFKKEAFLKISTEMVLGE